mmetsp:Transcript_16735/g.25288  ORF Transcript_16735/g.25288 Transcript_16735/m.25288 type:complete len:931 (-) Transcript_16735:76-2868(-)
MTTRAVLPHGKNPFLFVACLIVLIITTALALNDTSHYLSSNSVVLITGAAGFVGSELAMALYRTYSPKKIICVDSMDNMKWNNTLEEHLSLFDLKRQRSFHVWQTLGSTARFYRADFRPSIPEYFDIGEVPILDYIFREGEITHIVHLADAYHRGDDGVQAVPRKKHDIKSGMVEALMEQLRKVKEETGRLPHFTYASSYEVYNYFRPTQNDPNPSPFQEKLPITTPSSLGGTSKLIDEIITKTYFDKYGINSVGLRFFSIYGPWGLPHTPLYEMAERAVTTDEPVLPSLSHDDIRDYVYIDDAVDAIMAAMQFQSSNPHVINVGSGEGSSLADIAEMIEAIVPRPTPTPKSKPLIKTEAVADITRAQRLLGYQPQVSLSDGLVNLVSWHHDRAFPYGGNKNEKLSTGMASCSAFDKECLRGAPVYPCASECSHETQCITSYYNDVTALTMALSEDCEAVLYTVDLSRDLSEIPSATHDNKKSHFKSNLCNLAFVSEMSPLVRRLKQQNNYPFFSTVVEEFRHIHSTTGKKKFLSHGFWTLVPLPIPTFTVGDEHTLRLLPKLSPGSFFGESTAFAIYCDPDVVFLNINKLLQEAKMQPFNENAPGATALLVGHDDSYSESKLGPKPTIRESVQAAAYRMIRIGMIDEMFSHASFDSSWMVHPLLQNEDSRLFRCDVYGEVIQWDVPNDGQALEFVVGLHDMWARVLAKGKGTEPWWIGDQVVSVPMRQARRRLLEDKAPTQTKKATKGLESTAEMTKGANEKIEETENQESTGSKVEDAVADVHKSKLMVQSTSVQVGSSTDSVKNDKPDGKTLGATTTAKTFEVELDSSASQTENQQQVEDKKRAEEHGLEIVNELDLKTTELDLDEEADDDIVNTETTNGNGEEQDMSTYDTWMGMLSSTDVHYFVRIIPSSQVGVIHLKGGQEKYD